MWIAIRWPVVAVAVGAALVLLSFWLDTGSRFMRDLALPIGSIALFVLLPGAVIWLIVALTLHWRKS